jgi:hypothetical protein
MRFMIHQFADEVSAIQKALEEFDSGHRSNVVVLTEPFYEQDAGWIAEAIGPEATRIEGAYLADGHNLPDNAKVVIIEGLHRLYSRRISIRMVIPLLKFSIYGLAVYYIAGSLLEFSTAELIALSGLIGAAVGFGMKDLVAEVVGGLVIVLDKPYQVGDKVSML